DVRNYLAGEPIDARRDSFAYIVHKHLARHRVAAMAGATIVFAVLGALIVSLTFWRQAERQRILAQSNATTAQKSAERADREANQARAVTEFLREVLTSVDPDHQGADVRLTQVLTRASTTASQRFAGYPQQEAEVRDMLGRVLNKLSLGTDAQAEF